MESAGSVERQMTYGEKAVGLTFNPSGDEKVNRIKSLYAQIIDEMDDLRSTGDSLSKREQIRLASIAITEAQSAQMWAVKALTWKD